MEKIVTKKLASFLFSENDGNFMYGYYSINKYLLSNHLFISRMENWIVIESRRQLFPA